MTHKADLLGAVERTSHKDIIGLAVKSKAKKCSYSFQDVIKSLSEEEINELFDKLHKIVSDDVQTLIKPGPASNAQKSPSKKMRQDTCLFIQAVIDLALAVFEQGMPAPKSLLQTVIVLNRNIFHIPNTLEKMKNYIACLCERMFQLNYLYEENDKITVNTLLYLFKRILTTKGAKKDVKRIHMLRSRIPLLLTASDLDMNDVRETLKKCVASSVFLSASEGPAVIACILTADREHILDIHESIIKRLSSCSLTQGSAYGQAYLKAWKYTAKTGIIEMKEAIESMCICDLIVFGIKSRSKTTVGAVRKLLSQFICQKKEPQISKLLHDAYLPILWRFLKSHDGLMRANAAMLFLDVFPLEDPDVKIVETDMELNEQMLLIQDLLVDDFPIVRSSAVIGLFIAMSVHWELFPEEMLKTYFKVIINDLSCDSSCADVRSAVVKGFKVLLENPLALPTLKPILPKISHMFHDMSDNVRVAFVQLLYRVKKIATIKYFDIVPIDHLLARLEEDPIVAKSLVGLIQNSYFPKTEPPDCWIARCVQMVKKDRGASRIFFTFISSYIGIENTAHFISQTVKTVHYYNKSKNTAQPIQVHSGSSRNSSPCSIVGSAEALEEAVGFNDIDVVAGLMEGVAIMWLSCSAQFNKPENKTILKRMVAKMSKCMSDLNLYYKDTDAWEAVYLLASFLPPRTINCLPSLCYLKLKELPDEAISANFETTIDCLSNQDQIPELFGLLKTWIQAGFEKPELLVDAVQTPHPKRRRGKKTPPKTQVDDKPKPTLAVRILSWILKRKSSQKIILAMHSEQLKAFFDVCDKKKSILDILKEKLSSLAEEPVPFAEAEFYLIMFGIILDSAVLLHSECHQGENSINAVDFMDKLTLWVEGALLKHVTSDGQLSPKTKDATLDYATLVLCKNLCAVLADMSLLGYVNVKTLRFIKFSMKLLSLPIGPFLLCDVNKLVLRHTSFGIYHTLQQAEEQNTTDILKILPDCFSKIVHKLNDPKYMDILSPADIKEFQLSLAGSMALLHPHQQLKELVSSISLIITKHVLEALFADFEKLNLEKECVPFENIKISKSSACILQALAVKPNLLLYFLQHLQHYLIKLCRPKIDQQTWVACFIIVLHIKDLKCHTKNLDKEMTSMWVKLGEIWNRNTLGCVATFDNLMECDAIEENKKAMPSFIEHCQEEYKKLDRYITTRKTKAKTVSSTPAGSVITSVSGSTSPSTSSPAGSVITTTTTPGNTSPASTSSS